MTRDRRSAAAGATPLLLLAATLCVLAAGAPTASAVPLFNPEREFKDVVTLSSTDFANDADAACVVDDVLYAVGDSVPASDPCESCQCTGASSVKCLPVQCPLRPGCRAVQRNDQCCPDFKCECSVGDRLYDNGARIPEAGDPCQVCYCRGGSVQCAVLECFWRDDCEPSYEPGLCCPKFDHCPPPAGSLQHSSRPMNSSTPKMAELTSSENPPLPVVKFQQVFPSASPQPPQSVSFEESLELAETGTTLAAEEQTSTTSEESTTFADIHASRTPTQDGGPVTESAVEAPSEPSSAPENLEMHSNAPLTSTTTLEFTTELPSDLTHSEARNVESSTDTEQKDVTTTEENNTEEIISAEFVTDMSTDIPTELRFDVAETTTDQEISTEPSSDDKLIAREVQLSDIPETTTIITQSEMETSLPDMKDLEFSDTFTTLASASKTDVPETRTVGGDDIIETTTGQSDVGVTTEITLEAVASDQKLVNLNTEVPEVVTTEAVTTEQENLSREGGDVIEMIQSDKITENLETSTQSQEPITEEISATEETSTENSVTEESPEVESRTVEASTVLASTEDNQGTVNTETATDITTDNTDGAVTTNEGHEAGEMTTTEHSATESDTITERSEIEGRTEKNIEVEEKEVEEIERDNTTENAETEASTTDSSEIESRTAENSVSEDSTEVNATPEIETTEESHTTATEVETTTDVKTVTEKTTVETEIPENNSSLISLLRSNLVPAVGIDDENVNSDLVKNISNNMVPANLDDSKKEFEENNPSIIDEIAKTLERGEFPFNTSHKEASVTTELPEFELIGGHISDYDILSVPPARPVEAPAVNFPQVSGLNDWRLAALQDQDFEEFRGPPSWQDNQALAVDFGAAADFLNPSWPQQHLRRRRREDQVANYVQGRGRRNH